MFNQGQKPTIICINQAKTPLGINFDLLIRVLQQYVNAFLTPIWGTPANVIKGTKFVKGAWAIVLLDNADVSDALGYHDLTPDGLPLSKVFVKDVIANKEKVSTTATHELAEMLVDPAINLCAIAPNNLLYAYEAADAVEETTFLISGVPVSNFVFPSYFEGFHQPKSVKFDYLGLIKSPFEILPGGYMSVFDGNQWTEIFGSIEKKERFAQENRKGHRSLYRRPGNSLKCSLPKE